MKSTNSRYGSIPARIVIVASLAAILISGGYAVRWLIDYMEPVKLLPQQQKIRGYVQRELVAHGIKFLVYHPKEFELELVNTDFKRTRIMHFYGDRLFIGSKTGQVYWLDPPYTKTNILIRLDNYPHSVVVHEGFLYIAQTNGIYKAPYSMDITSLEEKDLELVVSMPGGNSHASRTIKIGPDNRLYVSIGMHKNCNDFFLDPSYPEKQRRGGLTWLDDSGPVAKLVPFASGLRNPVGFDWHPDTGVMYASNNGPDHLGLELPLEYFAKVTPGSFHGMPWYQYDGKKLFRDKCADFDPPKSMDEVSIPVATFPAHNAPLDVAFVPAHAKAKEFYGDALVALHGSWVTDNGSVDGDPRSRRHPKIVRVIFENGEAKEVIDLVTGFQIADGERLVRPAGVAVGGDGEIYFTSDERVKGLYRLKKK
jgi:glucose/arabinose dehydrogenase